MILSRSNLLLLTLESQTWPCAPRTVGDRDEGSCGFLVSSPAPGLRSVFIICPVTVTKYVPRSNFRQKVFFLAHSLWLTAPPWHGRQGSRQGRDGGRSQGLPSHFASKSEQEVESDCKASRPVPRDPVSPARLSLLKFLPSSQIVPSAKTQVFKHRSQC